MQKNTAVGEALIPKSALEAVVLTVLSQLKSGKIEEALAAFAVTSLVFSLLHKQDSSN